ncbi:MAG: asparagine synthase (glutamine-hydrolyzing) [Mesorhizobium sp.]|uniref:asparagine synthase (glutamine-hydrolyzing) n=1 Tax=unclassified Mesorhizobium TaxID=325217 RepID=UPI000F7584A2|nr:MULTISPECIES: asparagine synthase (glutamine-hydrolyzing) [unclassified Mesorhizobium]AZO74465.1 asparagine synthase (glutamine-hydrolyzing) [Mesorhizobium sp. M1D.F.Ca.ET.043.01.1.1]RWA96667.1 MAG: asparagine synthase (glutamine-hydrolyzing) [Mesorhizobium sp.]RWE18217.1 MAG: asparagine synthase (glutamine-hydrolyzing) [Mesorhizobium sp.]TJW86994.1 MAG: asparagine synthase (glutamine-hydrolyzing) [Mesorhizobium sp.]
MCGIVGIVGGAAATGSGASTVRRMADMIRHRGPDGDGVWTDAEAGVALSQRRLAIIDLSSAGAQPMTSHGGRYVIVFNGEIYNHAEMRTLLDRKHGLHAWRGHSDTEVLLAAIEELGLKKALELAVGMFAFGLWDRLERTLVLGRDRLGEKPLYYGRVGKAFAFASEIKAFSPLPNWRPEIDRNALALLMRHNYIPAPYSIYQGIRKLRPGEFLVLSDPMREPRVESYWSAREVAERGRRDPFQGSPEEAVDGLERHLRQALEGQMIADVPLGAFLSGGIDSSAIVAVMQSISSRPVRTFTIGFNEAGYNEAHHAQQVARRLGTDHTELYLSERDALDVVPQLPGIYCEPFSDSSQIPTFLVSKLARGSVKVALSGDGGDELFSGYTRYALADAFWNRLSRVPIGLRLVSASLAKLPSAGLYDNVAGGIMPLLPRRMRRQRVGDKIHKAASVLSLRSLDDVYRRLCSHWEPADIVLGAAEPPTMLTGLEPLPDLPGNVERMMYLDTMSYLPDDILVKVDRAAMAIGLETRVPLLDHRLVSFALSLPLSVLRTGGQTKWPLRQLLYRHVPQALVERPKMGFGVPIDAWLRGALRDWAEALLDERRLQEDGFFRSKPIRRAWSEHLSGHRNNQYLLWDVLMFQSWREAHQGASAAAAA